MADNDNPEQHFLRLILRLKFRNQDFDVLWERERAAFERRREVVANLWDMVSVMSKNIITQVKRSAEYMQIVTGTSEILSFATLPSPKDFIELITTGDSPTAEEGKVAGKYEAAYSTNASFEAALAPLTKALFVIQIVAMKEARDYDATRSSAENFDTMANETRMQADRIARILESLQPVVCDIDKLVKSIAAERASVNVRQCFTATDAAGRIKCVNEAWAHAKEVWGQPMFENTWQAKQLRMLRILWKFVFVLPVAEVCSGTTKAIQDVKEELSRRLRRKLSLQCS